GRRPGPPADHRGGASARAPRGVRARAPAFQRQLRLRDRLGARGAARAARERFTDRDRRDAADRCAHRDRRAREHASARGAHARALVRDDDGRPAGDGAHVHRELRWVGCQFPTDALAQDAGMATDQFADFLYAAVLRDWDIERERMRRYADLFDAADEVRIVAAATDLRLSLTGRQMVIDAGGKNLPGGEFFGSPVEDSAEGVITFSEYPGVYLGNECRGIRLRFEGGRVAHAPAERAEDFLLATLHTDDGARRLGELGIGCNPEITRHMKNTLFDEKIDGTVHLAVGNGIPDAGGVNQSAVHWDIVKDLRHGGRIELDGRVVQRDGAWQLAA